MVHVEAGMRRSRQGAQQEADRLQERYGALFATDAQLRRLVALCELGDNTEASRFARELCGLAAARERLPPQNGTDDDGE